MIVHGIKNSTHLLLTRTISKTLKANVSECPMVKDESLGWSLFGFNIGLEAGQIAVVTGILVLSFLVVNKARFNRKWWVWTLSVVALVKASIMVWERFPSLYYSA